MAKQGRLLQYPVCICENGNTVEWISFNSVRRKHDTATSLSQIIFQKSDYSIGQASI